MTPMQQVEHDLLAGRASLMTPHTAREWRLAAWAHYTAVPGSALHQECAGDFADAWARFLRLQSRFAELMAAWAAAGIDATVFKGAAVAYLAYPHPALRYFNDIDVYVEPVDAARALMALPTGWLIKPNLFFDAPHGPINLRSPCNELEIDLHRSLFRPSHVTSSRHKAVTGQLLESRRMVQVSSLEFRSLAPADLVLIGLAVNRGYGQDRWRPKAHDYLDILYLQQRLGLSSCEILARARQLGLRRTWLAYSHTCEPQMEVLQLGRSRWPYLWNDLVVARERSELPFYVSRLRRLPAAMRDVIVVMPTLLALLSRAYGVHSGAELQAVADPPLPARRSGFFPVRGVNWGLRLLAPLVARLRISRDMFRSIATHRLLHSQGIPVVWVCGTSDRGKATSGPEEEYAWLELNGFPLAIWPGDARRRVYAERLRIVLPAVDSLDREG